jgi:hypothetical protein
MTLGLSIETFTLLHVVLSLIGIAAGVVALWGLLTRRWLEGWTRAFLSTTVLTCLTGYGFPVDHLLPSHIVGALGVVQAFLKVPPLHALAPQQSEPPFVAAQGLVLLAFVVLGIVATARFRTSRTMPAVRAS